MHLIEVTPAPCNVCGQGNTAGSDGSRVLFVDFERDINWNDPLIICENCLASAGAMVGMVSKDATHEFGHSLSEKDREIHELRSEIDSMTRRAKKLGMTFDPVTAS